MLKKKKKKKQVSEGCVPYSILSREFKTNKTEQYHIQTDEYT